MVENKYGNACAYVHISVQIHMCIFEYVIKQQESINCFLCVDIWPPSDNPWSGNTLVYLGIMFVRGRRPRLYESGNIHPFFLKLNIHHSPRS